MEHWKITMGDTGYLTRVEVDGKLSTNIEFLKVEFDSRRRTILTVRIVPESVILEGDLSEKTVVAVPG